MRPKRISIGSPAILASLMVTLFLTSAWATVPDRVIYNLGKGANGAGPMAGLIFDASGNLYGTTVTGGDSGGGTVFELTPNAGGGWAEKRLHSFSYNQSDGCNPYAGLVRDASGNLYGTTGSCGAYGGGIAFELTPVADGSWSEKVLHNFGNNPNGGSLSWGSLIFDNLGNLYGTTVEGGTYAGESYGGTVFELTPNPDGSWTETVLYSFCGQLGCTDGSYPFGAVVFDASGNLYGTTSDGGDSYRKCVYGCGTVFELTPSAGGGWKEKVLHSFTGFDGGDGANPSAGLIFDASGNLYGTTYSGGSTDFECSYTLGCGMVFQLKPRADGIWSEKVLHKFNHRDGAGPESALVFDTSGNLYGTTECGGEWSGKCQSNGPYDGCGMLFELTPTAGGGWTEKVLHKFQDNGRDGLYPNGVIIDAIGSLYGTTYQGGTYTVGMVFEVRP